jgi:short-subunit dehydrogenase
MSVAIITGASGGIGSEFARQLSKIDGIDELWLVARSADRMKRLGEEIGIKTRVISADLTTAEGIGRVREALESERPSVRFLVNASGFGNFGAFDELSEGEVCAMIDLNVKALVVLTHMTVPYMERGGRIIELGSGSCFTPLPYFNVYSSSKVFVLHYTKSLNHELKKYGVRATCFCPGWVETEFLGKSTANGNRHPKSMKPLLKCEDVVRKCVKASLRGRVMCVTNWYTKLQHLMFKLLPDSLLTKIWLGMLTDGDGKEGK